MIRVRNPSLEFNWLPNSLRKGLSTPRLVIVDRNDCGGFCCQPTLERCVHPWVEMDVAEGAVIGVSSNELDIAGTLAHEYRHYWQWFSYSKSMAQSVWNHRSTDYKAAIISYFRSYWWEMDALKFQLKYAPDDVSRLWWDWLMEAPCGEHAAKAGP